MIRRAPASQRAGESLNGAARRHCWSASASSRELRAALSEARRAAAGSSSSRLRPGSARRACCARPRDMPPEAGFTCLRARATELERDFAYGCVRQLLEPVVAKASERRARPSVRGRRRALEAAVRPTERRTGPAPRPISAFVDAARPLLAAQQPRRRGPRRRSASTTSTGPTRESLRFLNYLAPRLDGLAARGARRDPQRRGRHGGPGPAGGRPGDDGAAARAAEHRGDGDAVRAQARRRGRRRVRGGLPRGDRRQPVLSRGAAARGRRSSGSRPTRRGAARVRRHRPGRRRPGGARCASRGAPPRRPRSCAPSRCSATARASPRRRGSAELSRAGGGPRRRPAGRARDPEPAERLEFAHPIVREAVYADIGAHERAEAHARAAAILAGERRVRGADRGPDRRGGAGRRPRARRAAAARGRGRARARRAGRGRRLAPAGAGRAPAARAGPRCCSSWARRSCGSGRRRRSSTSRRRSS